MEDSKVKHYENNVIFLAWNFLEIATSNDSTDLLEKTLQNKDIISGLLDSKNLNIQRVYYKLCWFLWMFLVNSQLLKGNLVGRNNLPV